MLYDKKRRGASWPTTKRILQDWEKVQAKRGMTDEAMAKWLGLDSSTIRYWRLGKNRPSRLALNRIREKFRPYIDKSRIARYTMK